MTVDELAEMLHKSYAHNADCGWPLCPEYPSHREFIYEFARGLLPQLVEVREP